MNWYKKLDINQRINLKGLCEVVTGIPFDLMTSLYGLKTAIELIEDKLRAEGFMLD